MATIYKKKSSELGTYEAVVEKSSTKKPVPKWVMWVAFSVFVGIFSVFNSEKSGGDTYEAWWYATEFVQDRLKSPSSAKFSPHRESIVAKMDTNHYTVMGWVDAQNSFGATLRTGWEATVRHDTDGWRCENVKIDSP
jgi:hypothetical protein